MSNPNAEIEFYPLIQAKIEFHPFIQKERYPLMNGQRGFR